MRIEKQFTTGLIQIMTVALLTVAPAYSQVSFGIKAGVPLNNAYTTNTIPDGTTGQSNPRYTVGVTVEKQLPANFSIEADVLYRHSSFYGFGGPPLTPNGKVEADTFQVPLMVKYEVPLSKVSPFVDFGAAYRHVHSSGNGAPDLVGAQHADSAAIVLGAGVAFKWRRVKISPEIRYTGWAQHAFDNAAVTSNVNQADLLVGFTFPR